MAEYQWSALRGLGSMEVRGIETPKCILTARRSRWHCWAFAGDGCEPGIQTEPAAAWLILRRDVNAKNNACQSPRLNWCQQERQVVEQAGGVCVGGVPQEENSISTFTNMLIRLKVMLRLLQLDQFCLRWIRSEIHNNSQVLLLSTSSPQTCCFCPFRMYL